MKVEPVTYTDATASPAHPDHARWVKDKTLAMEIEHAKVMGGSLRNAEDENNRLLARMEQVARGRTRPRPERPRKPRPERLAERGVTMKTPARELTRHELSPCGRCGTCRRCKRERRVLLMSQKALEGDVKLISILWHMSMVAQQAKDGTGKFHGMPARDANRFVIALIERACDDSIASMGAWR